MFIFYSKSNSTQLYRAGYTVAVNLHYTGRSLKLSQPNGLKGEFGNMRGFAGINGEFCF